MEFTGTLQKFEQNISHCFLKISRIATKFAHAIEVLQYKTGSTGLVYTLNAVILHMNSIGVY